MNGRLFRCVLWFLNWVFICFCIYGSEFVFCCSLIIEFCATLLDFWCSIYVICDNISCGRSVFLVLGIWANKGQNVWFCGCSCFWFMASEPIHSSRASYPQIQSKRLFVLKICAFWMILNYIHLFCFNDYD